MAESAVVASIGATLPDPATPAAGGELAGALGLLARLAVEDLGGAAEASFSARSPDGGRPRVLAWSSGRAHSLDEVQRRCQRGPVCHALAGGGETGGLLPDGRWPELSEMASTLGVHSVWTVPVGSAEEPLATLSLYAGTAGSWPGPRAGRARLLAQVAQVIINDARAVAELTRGNDTLQEALQTRTVIGQAQGILMARQNIDAPAAFDVLRRASQRSNRKLRDIAADLVAGATRRPAPTPPIPPPPTRPAAGDGNRP